MPVIYSRAFATGNQQYLTLGPDAYMRMPSIGTGWNRIRIGILYAMSTVSETTWPIRNCSFTIGVCNGIANAPCAQSPTHAFGYSSPAVPANATGASTITYNAGTSGNSYFAAGTFSFFRIAAGVTTTAGVGSLTVNVPSNTTLGGALARRGLFILDINKSAPNVGNITQGASGSAVAHCSLDLTTADLYSALEWYTSAPTIQGTALSFLAVGNTLAFNESTNGILDTVFVNWSHLTVPLQLYEIGVYRVG